MLSKLAIGHGWDRCESIASVTEIGAGMAK